MAQGKQYSNPLETHFGTLVVNLLIIKHQFVFPWQLMYWCRKAVVVIFNTIEQLFHILLVYIHFNPGEM
jgi:hypothetical protein